jgi:hypothetical protein
MKYSSIDLNGRRTLDTDGKPFPLEFGPVVGDMVLRSAKAGNVLVAYAAGLVEKSDGSSYQHVFTCHRGGTVVIPFNPLNEKVAFVGINRPVVPPDSVDEYTRAWDAHIERKDPRHSDFARELFPMLGLDTYQFPQGYGEAGEASEANALRVLKTQGGFDNPLELKLLDGYTVIDPGNRVSPVSFYLARVDPTVRRADSSLPPIIWFDEQEYFRQCQNEWIISDFTRSGYSLLKENGIW